MSRHVELERILQAWFDWESCSGHEKNQRRETFHAKPHERLGNSVSNSVLAADLSHHWRANNGREKPPKFHGWKTSRDNCSCRTAGSVCCLKKVIPHGSYCLRRSNGFVARPFWLGHRSVLAPGGIFRMPGMP